MTDAALPPAEPAPPLPPPVPQPAAPGPSAFSDERQTALIIYILLLVPIIIPITHIVGLVLAYVNRADAPPWLKSHYDFQIRTFWIGVLYFIVACLLIVLLVGILLVPVVMVWYIVRCALGIDRLMKRQPYPTPQSWTI